MSSDILFSLYKDENNVVWIEFDDGSKERLRSVIYYQWLVFIDTIRNRSNCRNPIPCERCFDFYPCWKTYATGVLLELVREAIAEHKKRFPNFFR
jgi:hypothetical protein